MLNAVVYDVQSLKLQLLRTLNPKTLYKIIFLNLAVYHSLQEMELSMFDLVVKMWWSHFLRVISGYKNWLIYVLSLGTEQLNPHLINCEDGEEQDSFCVEGVSRNFCRTKPSGIYEHPSFCNSIIYCTSGEREVVQCPTGTGFNPYFLNCDWPGFLRCVDIRRGIDIFFKTTRLRLIFLRLLCLFDVYSLMEWVGGWRPPNLDCF